MRSRCFLPNFVLMQMCICGRLSHRCKQCILPMYEVRIHSDYETFKIIFFKTRGWNATTSVPVPMKECYWRPRVSPCSAPHPSVTSQPEVCALGQWEGLTLSSRSCVERVSSK
ncbi:hypothetical protein CEXT_559231 [Caerostris extrusa]|uniref:Secreted protein n=1 Tax=Caerostris extrusa TaxID=172846 RepID=A0AAV4UV66_CAEEX|nr:hypothetical protein CEXT_559231 [Caerostris extrusa]